MSECFSFHTVTCIQVLNFVQEFADMLPDYEIACEHEHSNCVLIAHKKVHVCVYNTCVLYTLYCCMKVATQLFVLSGINTSLCAILHIRNWL